MAFVHKAMEIIKRIFIDIIILIIKAYQIVISPLFPPSCRFYPTCSSYSIEAFKRHGIMKGFLLTIMRIIRCNPFNNGGPDPVPDTFHFFK